MIGIGINTTMMMLKALIEANGHTGEISPNYQSPNPQKKNPNTEEDDQNRERKNHRRHRLKVVMMNHLLRRKKLDDATLEWKNRRLKVVMMNHRLRRKEPDIQKRPS
jgi:hypothetical protein